MSPLLHVAAFWVADDRVEELADLFAAMKIEGTAGAVVTFRPEVADEPGFRRVMERLDLAEVNEHPASLELGSDDASEGEA